MVSFANSYYEMQTTSLSKVQNEKKGRRLKLEEPHPRCSFPSSHQHRSRLIKVTLYMYGLTESSNFLLKNRSVGKIFQCLLALKKI